MLAAAASSSAEPAASQQPIQLNCGLAVDPKRGREFIKYFDTVFRPVARKHQGYIDLKPLKLNQAVSGPVPPGGTFRSALTYESEALRQKWIASDDRVKAWAPLEDMSTGKNFGILVYDAYQAA
jgi:hypothetical protein